MGWLENTTAGLVLSASFATANGAEPPPAPAAPKQGTILNSLFHCAAAEKPDGSLAYANLVIVDPETNKFRSTAFVMSNPKATATGYEGEAMRVVKEGGVAKGVPTGGTLSVEMADHKPVSCTLKAADGTRNTYYPAPPVVPRQMR